MRSLPRLFCLTALLPLVPISFAAEPLRHMEATDSAKVSAAYRWLDIAQEATAREVNRNAPRPTVIARTLAIWATATYDAWAGYDATAVGSRLGDPLRRAVAEHTEANKEKTIAHASFHALLYVYPADRTFLEAAMRRMGQDPAIFSEDPATP